MATRLNERKAGDGVRVVALNRPPANALTPDFLDEIRTRFAELAADGGVRAVVLTGGGRVFSAGMDLKLLPSLDAAGQRACVEALNRCYADLYGFPKPLIAAVNGHAVAGGLFFALVADRRLAARGDGRFGLTEVKVGAPFPVGALEIARAELTPPAFRRMMTGGDLFGVEEAVAAGAIDEVVAPGSLIERAVGTAAAYAESPARSYAEIKRQCRAPALEAVRRAVELGADPQLDGWLDPETPAAIARVLKS